MRKKSQGSGLFENAKAESENASAPIENAKAENVNAEKPIENASGKVRLSDFVEDPDNLSTITDRAFDRLMEKVERIPVGLTAKRIAFVTDHPAGKRVVLQGNKRLRALKLIYGETAEVPDDWFQDITLMSEDQRNEFVVDANVNDGKIDADKLLAKYDREKLEEWISADKIGELIAVVESSPSAPASASGKAAETVKLVEFKLALSSADFKRATEYLRKRSDDMSVAFMEVINARSQVRA